MRDVAEPLVAAPPPALPAMEPMGLATLEGPLGRAFAVDPRSRYLLLAAVIKIFL